MTATTREILDRFQIRKSKKQKTAFVQWLRPILAQQGYEMKIEKGSGARNIVIGDVDKAKVVFTAHYDTCVKLPVPNFITPKCITIYLLYQVVLSIAIILAACGAAFVVGVLAGLIHRALILVGIYVGYLGVLFLFMFGPANRHNVNDNTSGVTAVLELLEQMPQDLREKAAFVLFDLEEMGLVGSSTFFKSHKKAMNEKLLVNLDCVSDGETMLFCFRKKSVADEPMFRQCFPSNERVESDFVTRGYVNPSDHIKFPRGVGVVALNRTKRGILYMNKIHTKRDTVYREENIAYLVEGCIRLTEQV